MRPTYTKPFELDMVHIPVIPALGSRQEGHKFKVILIYTELKASLGDVRPSQK